MLLPFKEGGMGYKVYPYTWEVLWKSSEEGHQPSDPVVPSIPSSSLPPLIEEGIQNEEGSGYNKSGYNPALQWLQDYNQAKAQLECKLSKQAQKLAHKCDDPQIKLAKKHEWKWMRMTQEGHTTFQEVFAMASPMELIKLLPWCISSVVPSQYMNEALGKMPPPPQLCLNQRGHPLWGLPTVQLIFLKLLLPSYLSCLISPLWALPL